MIKKLKMLVRKFLSNSYNLVLGLAVILARFFPFLLCILPTGFYIFKISDNPIEYNILFALIVGLLSLKASESLWWPKCDRLYEKLLEINPFDRYHAIFIERGRSCNLYEMISIFLEQALIHNENHPHSGKEAPSKYTELQLIRKEVETETLRVTKEFFIDQIISNKNPHLVLSEILEDVNKFESEIFLKNSHEYFGRNLLYLMRIDSNYCLGLTIEISIKTLLDEIKPYAIFSLISKFGIGLLIPRLIQEQILYNLAPDVPECLRKKYLPIGFKKEGQEQGKDT